MHGKKGLSTVVATVLIILLTIAIAGLLARFLVPYVKGNLERSTECINFDDYFQFEDNLEINGQEYNYNCYQTQPGNRFLIGASIKTVTLEGDASDAVGEINIVFEDEQDVKTPVKIKDGDNANNSDGKIWVLGNKAATLSIPKQGEIITYVYNTTRNITNAETYAVLKTGRICDSMERIKINACKGGIELD